MAICGYAADFEPGSTERATVTGTDHEGNIPMYTFLRGIMKRPVDAFISYNSVDEEEVKKVASYLLNSGIEIYFASRDIALGEKWKDSILNAINDARSILVFVGASGITDAQRWEIELSERTHEENTVIPVLLPEVDKVSLYNDPIFQYQWIDFSTGLVENDKLDYLVRAIKNEGFLNIGERTNKIGSSKNLWKSFGSAIFTGTVALLAILVELLTAYTATFPQVDEGILRPIAVYVVVFVALALLGGITRRLYLSRTKDQADLEDAVQRKYKDLLEIVNQEISLLLE